MEAAQKKAAKLHKPGIYGDCFLCSLDSRRFLVGAEYPLSYGREIIDELNDTFASPMGWHTLPFSHDPSVSEEEQTAFGRFLNY